MGWNFFKMYPKKQKAISRRICKFVCQGYFCLPVFTLCDRKVHFWLNSYLDLHHLQGLWNLPHKFHLYLIYILAFNVIMKKPVHWGSQYLTLKYWRVKCSGIESKNSHYEIICILKDFDNNCGILAKLGQISRLAITIIVNIKI